MEKIMILLGLSPITQIIILILLGSVSIVWWIYSKAMKDISSKEKSERDMLKHFYDPAITLIKLKKGRRISRVEFESKFGNLLVSNMSNVYSKDSEMEVNSWINGEDNITDLLSSFESDKEYINKRLQRFPVRKIFSWLGDEILIYSLVYVFFWTVILASSIESYRIISSQGVKIYLFILYGLIGCEAIILWVLFVFYKKKKNNRK